MKTDIETEKRLEQAARDLEKAYSRWWAQGASLLIGSTALSGFNPDAARIAEKMRKHLPELSKESEAKQKSGGLEA